MTRAQIIARVVANTGRGDKESIADAAIGEALVEAGQLHEFKSMQQEEELAISSGSNVATLPANTFQVVSTRLIDGVSSYKLAHRPKVWFEKHFPNPAQLATGRPVYCYEEAGQLVLIPIPNADYTAKITVIRMPTLETGVDLQPPELAGYVVAWVTAEVYRSTEQFDNATVWEGRAQQRLAIAIRADNQRGAEHIADQYPDDLASASLDPFRDPFYGVANTD